MAALSRHYALITGGTEGIGHELARLFAQDGYGLILVARTDSALQQRAQELSAQYGVDVVPIACDLMQPGAAAALYDDVQARSLTVEVLVNDAGQGQFGLFVEQDLQRLLDIVQLNVASVTALTHLFLKDMVARNQGKVLQLASVASEAPGPWQAVYHATKAYVLQLSEALANELKDTHVTVTALQPGATDTDFFRKAGMLDSRILDSKLADPAQVARDGHDALLSGDAKVVSGLKNKVMVAMSNVLPDSLVAEQINRQQKPRDGAE
ncbi:hypothetical protein SAMN05428957_106153 [Oryzisolibacter propanilivorax]|uniref:Short-chain dehydrogenase n=1 Tax=Oryzisolibacter propanilivorax TaxID=1527607 RepID=A0A1G9TK00_9BURK|nr:SDR family oxidoreductase [Oryzisolibacter propanilivorax]SDM47505.1 hypothetical protein SAMN05428957_106153 [Oryzisolibacter propanilivorax]